MTASGRQGYVVQMETKQDTQPTTVVLSVAGSDSGAGAGIQADLKSIHANGGYALTALTSVTAQNTQHVASAFHLPPEIIRAQISALAEDFEIASAKTGMLATAQIVETVAEALRDHGIAPLVVDPVMVSTSGYSLLEDDGREAVRRALLPLAALCTPNLPEAEVLSGISIETLDQAQEAARRICDLGPAAVLIKGGHGDGDTVTDLLFDGQSMHRFIHPRIRTRATHGTGCALSAAIAARLGRGESLLVAVERSLDYVTRAISAGISIGRGHSPTGLFFHQPGDWKTPERGGG